MHSQHPPEIILNAPKSVNVPAVALRDRRQVRTPIRVSSGLQVPAPGQARSVSSSIRFCVPESIGNTTHVRTPAFSNNPVRVPTSACVPTVQIPSNIQGTPSACPLARVPRATRNIVPHASVADPVRCLLSVTDPSCVSPSVSVRVCVPELYNIQSSIPTACSKSES